MFEPWGVFYHLLSKYSLVIAARTMPAKPAGKRTSASLSSCTGGEGPFSRPPRIFGALTQGGDHAELARSHCWFAHCFRPGGAANRRPIRARCRFPARTLPNNQRARTLLD